MSNLNTMTKLITNAEIKKILGISGDLRDGLIDMWNEIATNYLNELLQVENLVARQVGNERVKLHDPYKMYLEEFPVNIEETITLKDTKGAEIAGIYFGMDPKAKREVRFYDSVNSPRSVNHTEILVSYTGGFTVKDNITVSSITDLVDKTLIVKILGEETTWTFKTSGATENQINIGVDANACATSIATALGGTVSGAEATLPLGSSVELGTATTSQVAITKATIPPVLKTVIALIVGGGIAEKNKKGGVISYTIGEKTVNFRSNSDAKAVKLIIETWVPFFKIVNIQGV